MSGTTHVAAADDAEVPYSHFDICGPLPGPGVTVLEASAGTGKTFTIAALVTRMVAEGVAPLADILVVTFTRMATGELRQRARKSLADAEAGLARLLAEEPGPVEARLLAEGPPPPWASPLLVLLAEGTRGDVMARRQRLVDALSGFDAATVTTTHGFCHAMLETLGVRGEVADGAALLEDPGDVVAEVVDDLYLRHALRSEAPPFGRANALQAGAQAVANPSTPLDPAPDRSDESAAGLRRRLAGAVRDEVEKRLLDANLLTYDGLLVRLASALRHPGRGPAACARLRQRYRVVLVDEFQDTDLVQWDVVRRAFADGSTTLVLIGDPKQAVYAFRGADVYAYLEAARTAPAHQRFTLERNWRSDLALLEAYNALFTPVQFGHPDIRYRPALATVAHRRPGLNGAPSAAPVRARIVDRRAPWAQRTGKGLVQKSAGIKLIAEDLAGDVVALLSSGATLVRWSSDGASVISERLLGPGDIGVLVRTNRQATVVQTALRAVGVPAVVAGAESVLSTPAARHWLSLLEALEKPAARPRAVAAALSPFIGMSPLEVATASDSRWEEVHELLHGWAALVRQDGIASLYASVCFSQDLPRRLLAQLDGERELTDLGHVAELLHGQGRRDHLGLASLRAWLARRAVEGPLDATEADRRSRRLDSGSDAVQLLTVHRAKGLEFPVVYCPYLWDGSRPDRHGGPVVFHDPEDGSRRKLDVGGDENDPGYRVHFAGHQAEARGEDLRHLYVALTRACHQVVVWWAGAQDSQHSALGRLLLRRDLTTGQVAASGAAGVPADEQVRSAWAAVGGRAPGLVSVESVAPARGTRWAGPALEGERAQLSTAVLARSFDYKWRRASFTSVTTGAHLPGGPVKIVSSEPEEMGTNDEPNVGGTGLGREGAPQPAVLLRSPGTPAPVPDRDQEAGAGISPPRPSLLSDVPAGAEVGTFVHQVLQNCDFSSTTLDDDMRELVSGQELAYPGPVSTLDGLATGLVAACRAPLGPLANGLRLADIAPRDRLNELSFELPVAGGELARAEVSLGAIEKLWRHHLEPPAPLAGYADRLADPGLETELRGYLTGSLDLVFRAPLPGTGNGHRYFLADYKTNWLGPPGEPLTTRYYRGPVLEAEMMRAHYPLQAIFYLVALHRYLRWRAPGYRPEVHLGGALYLFLRGMATEPGDPRQPEGVFAWAPPTGLITDLSDLLGSGV